jgi:hypothetical protein
MSMLSTQSKQTSLSVFVEKASQQKQPNNTEGGNKTPTIFKQLSLAASVNKSGSQRERSNIDREDIDQSAKKQPSFFKKKLSLRKESFRLDAHAGER